MMVENLRKAKVLVIDDELTIRELLMQILEERFEVLCAASAIEGLRAAKANSPDLILLDILMPGDDGIACLEELRRHEETVSIPVLMLTAVNDEITRARAFDAGADDYIIKPFRPKALIERIEVKLQQVNESFAGVVQPMRVRMGDVVVDLSSSRVLNGSQELALAPTEFKIFSYLFHRKGKFLPQEELLRSIGGISHDEFETCIASLRGKLNGTSVALNKVHDSGYALALKADQDGTPTAD